MITELKIKWEDDEGNKYTYQYGNNYIKNDIIQQGSLKTSTIRVHRQNLEDFLNLLTEDRSTSHEQVDLRYGDTGEESDSETYEDE